MTTEMPAALRERVDHLQAQFDRLQRTLDGRMKERDRARSEEAEVELTTQIAAILDAQARIRETINGLTTDTMVLFYQREEEEAKRRRAGDKPKEGKVDVPEEPVPDALKSASATVDEIVTELRIKRGWSFQRVVDFLVAQGKAKKKGGTNWHTSDVYAIEKRLLRA